MRPKFTVDLNAAFYMYKYVPIRIHKLCLFSFTLKYMRRNRDMADVAETGMCGSYVDNPVYLFGMRKFILYEILRQDEV